MGFDVVAGVVELEDVVVLCSGSFFCKLLKGFRVYSLGCSRELRVTELRAHLQPQLPT